MAVARIVASVAAALIHRAAMRGVTAINHGLKAIPLNAAAQIVMTGHEMPNRVNLASLGNRVKPVHQGKGVATAPVAMDKRNALRVASRCRQPPKWQQPKHNNSQSRSNRRHTIMAQARGVKAVAVAGAVGVAAGVIVLSARDKAIMWKTVTSRHPGMWSLRRYR